MQSMYGRTYKFQLVPSEDDTYRSVRKKRRCSYALLVIIFFLVFLCAVLVLFLLTYAVHYIHEHRARIMNTQEQNTIRIKLGKTTSNLENYTSPADIATTEQYSTKSTISKSLIETARKANKTRLQNIYNNGLKQPSSTTMQTTKENSPTTQYTEKQENDNNDTMKTDSNNIHSQIETTTMRTASESSLTTQYAEKQESDNNDTMKTDSNNIHSQLETTTMQTASENSLTTQHTEKQENDNNDTMKTDSNIYSQLETTTMQTASENSPITQYAEKQESDNNDTMKTDSNNIHSQLETTTMLTTVDEILTTQYANKQQSHNNDIATENTTDTVNSTEQYNNISYAETTNIISTTTEYPNKNITGEEIIDIAAMRKNYPNSNVSNIIELTTKDKANKDNLPTQNATEQQKHNNVPVTEYNNITETIIESPSNNDITTKASIIHKNVQSELEFKTTQTTKKKNLVTLYSVDKEKYNSITVEEDTTKYSDSSKILTNNEHNAPINQAFKQVLPKHITSSILPYTEKAIISSQQNSTIQDTDDNDFHEKKFHELMYSRMICQQQKLLYHLQSTVLQQLKQLKELSQQKVVQQEKVVEKLRKKVERVCVDR